MKALHVVIIVAVLFVALAARSSSAHDLFSPPRPTSGTQTYQYFVPPGAAHRSTKPRTEVKIPQPESVAIDAQYAKGTIVIINHERALYFVEDVGRASRYPVAIGSPVDQWEGMQTITAKRENPKWYPSEDIQWEMGVPSVVMPGPHNPLGPRALYLGDTLYRIHGTNRPGSIGGAVSHGCFRMHNSHIIELYEKVQIGAGVYVVP
jgi:lipoprotein-anchoring transpeptidase ErfK/SrfK